MTQEGLVENRETPSGGLRIVVALKPEADPLIGLLELKPVAGGEPFRCWKNKNGSCWLVLTGIGKTAAAAGTAWLHAISGASPAAAWINLGIAGHPSLEPGELRRVHKITDAGSGRSWYPPLVVGSRAEIESANLITVDRPAEIFPDSESLVDMEAAGFVETAARFGSLELVSSFKVVSDNAETGFEGLKSNRDRVRQLMASLVEKLETSGVFAAFSEASANESLRLADPPEFGELMARHHFTVSQQHQLRRFLQRRRALGRDLQNAYASAEDARSVLRVLRQELSAPPA